MKNIKIEKQKWGPFLKLYRKVRIPWLLYIGGYLMQFVITTVNLQLPKLTGDIMSGKIFNKAMIWKFVGLTLLAALIQCIQRVIYVFSDNKLIKNAQNLIWSKIIRLPLTYYNKEKPSGLISRVSSDTSALSTPLNSISSLIDGVYGIAGSFIIMYGMNKTLTLYVILVLPWVIFVTWIISRLAFKASKKLQMNYSSMTGFINERLGSIKLIKFFGSENKETEEGFKVIKKYYNAGIFNSFIISSTVLIGSTINIAITLITIVLGARLTYTGKLDISDLISFYMYVNNMVLPAIFAIVGFVEGLKGAQGTAEKISNIFVADTEEMTREKSFNIPDADITFKNVSFSYSNKEILSDLSFTIPKGKVTAIVGQNGAGKTTIFNLIERFYTPKSGEILFGNIPVEKIHLDEWRKAFGYVSQNSPLLSGSIRDNITYGVSRDISEEEIIKAAKLANAYEFIEKFPEKFDTEVGEIGGKLSGGQRQRIAIARAIIKNPDYLLLDEATCNLDAYCDKLVEEALHYLMEGRTTIVIAHNMHTIEDADNIIVIDNGKVQGSGKHKELYESSEIYHKFVNLQNVC